MQGQPRVTVARARRLQARRETAHIRAHDLDVRFALAILALREQGWSARKLAVELGIGATTVHDWTERGRQARG